MTRCLLELSLDRYKELLSLLHILKTGQITESQFEVEANRRFGCQPNVEYFVKIKIGANSLFGM